MKRLWAVLLVVVLASPALGLDPNAADLFVRVADSGPALCCVVKIPPGEGETKAHYVIYDGGNYTDRGECAFEKIKEIIPQGSDVDLLVLSHSDSDHLGAVGEICDAYKVKRVLRSGYQRTSGTWKDANDAVRASVKLKGSIDINLRLCEFPAGATYRIGNAFMQMVCGFHKPPAAWGSLNDAKEKNAGSIVIRLTYGGKAIMFTGDAVRRNEGDPNDAAPIATEKFMLTNKDVIRLDSEVLIAPHHGADNASSAAFIAAVKPTWVVFSAGHKYSHPTRKAAGRYLAAGVKLANMFRTDLMDDEGPEEWAFGRVSGHKDPAGDDDVDVVVGKCGAVRVEYREAANQKRHLQAARVDDPPRVSSVVGRLALLYRGRLLPLVAAMRPLSMTPMILGNCMDVAQL